MNKPLLIVLFSVFLMYSCSTISETTNYNYKNHAINVINDSIVDVRFDSILLGYKVQVDSQLSEVIAICNEPLISYRPESPLSNFLSDMILEYSQAYCRNENFKIRPQISLFNHGGIRSSLPQGEITMMNAFQIMPFENELVLLQLTGEQIINLADYICTRKGEGVAGISFGMYENKAVDIKVQGVNIDKNQQYWLVTSDYIANGGDGMKVLTWADQKVETGVKLRDIIIDTLKDMTANGQNIDAKADGRIYHVE